MSWGLWLVRNYHQSRWVWGELVGNGQVIFSKVQEARAESVRLGGNSGTRPKSSQVGVESVSCSQQFLFNVIAADMGGGVPHVAASWRATVSVSTPHIYIERRPRKSDSMQTEEEGRLLKQHLGSSPFSYSPTARRGFLKATEDGNDNNAWIWR